MKRFKRSPIFACQLLIAPGLSGCGASGAPSFELFGAYFPASMFCALIGILVAIGARIVFVATRVSDQVPLQLFVCSAIGVITALLLWFFWFGQ